MVKLIKHKDEIFKINYNNHIISRSDISTQLQWDNNINMVQILKDNFSNITKNVYELNNILNFSQINCHFFEDKMYITFNIQAYEGSQDTDIQETNDLIDTLNIGVFVLDAKNYKVTQHITPYENKRCLFSYMEGSNLYSIHSDQKIYYLDLTKKDKTWENYPLNVEIPNGDLIIVEKNNNFLVFIYKIPDPMFRRPVFDEESETQHWFQCIDLNTSEIIIPNQIDYMNNGHFSRDISIVNITFNADKEVLLNTYQKSTFIFSFEGKSMRGYSNTYKYYNDNYYKIDSSNIYQSKILPPEDEEKWELLDLPKLDGGVTIWYISQDFSVLEYEKRNMMMGNTEYTLLSLDNNWKYPQTYYDNIRINRSLVNLPQEEAEWKQVLVIKFINFYPNQYHYCQFEGGTWVKIESMHSSDQKICWVKKKVSL